MSVPRSLRFRVFARDGFVCQYCGQHPPAVRLECDHIHPRSKGGNDDFNNLVTACFDCNRGKRGTLVPAILVALARAAEEQAAREAKRREEEAPRKAKHLEEEARIRGRVEAKQRKEEAAARVRSRAETKRLQQRAAEPEPVSFLRLESVQDRVFLELGAALSEESLYGLIRDGRFPSPLQLTRRTVAWVNRDVQKFVDQRITERHSDRHSSLTRSRSVATARATNNALANTEEMR